MRKDTNDDEWVDVNLFYIPVPTTIHNTIELQRLRMIMSKKCMKRRICNIPNRQRTFEFLLLSLHSFIEMPVIFM